MVYSAIAFLLGCMVILQLPALPGWPVWLAAALLFAIFCRYRRWPLAVMLLAMCWTGLQADYRLNHSLADNLIGQDIKLQGRIASIPEQQTHRSRFIIETNHPDLPSRLRLNWYYPPADQPQAGQQWQLTVRLKPPAGMLNPGSFDYEGWLFQNNIRATGYVRDAIDNKKLADAPLTSINHWRAHWLDRLQQSIPDAAARSLIAGLTVGSRSEINDQQWQVLRDTGTSHLLAISGLHIGLAAALGFFLGRWLWACFPRALLLIPAPQFAAICAMIAALFYALMAGMSVPSQRALIMVCVMMLALVMRRSVLSYQLLTAALLLVLIWDPFAVLSAGLWLSFAAVGIIVYVSQQRRPVPKWQWARIHLWIALGLTPLLLIFFNTSSVIAPVANLIAVPIVSLLVVPVLLAAMLLSPLSGWLSNQLLHCAELVLNLLWWLLDILAGLPVAVIHSPGLPLGLICFAIVGLLWLFAPRGWPARWLGLFCLIPVLVYTPPRPDEGDVWFTLLDVGQGLSAVVQTQSHTLVFDTGPAYGSFNTGEAVVLPFLQHNGIKMIDALVISHGDNDHIGGAAAVMDSLPISNIYSSVPNQLPAAKHCYAGEKWHWDGVDFSFLYPAQKDQGSDNHLSCVLKIDSAHGRILLTGDIEQAAEQQLISRYGKQLAAEILVAAHHGSNSSSGQRFLETVEPEFVLFATGYRNRYQFPSEQVVNRLQKMQIPTLNTADSGAIMFKLQTGTSGQPVRWRQQAKRLWTLNATE